jgi:adenine-specific DNA-methyltransferase
MSEKKLDDLMPNTPNVGDERLAELRRLFPDLFDGEGHIKLDDLKQLTGELPPQRERYDFTWSGKHNAKAEAYRPTSATLTYDEARSVNPEKADGNLIIEGENLAALKCLLPAYKGQVKCIYIDPPYNTTGDFIYSDNYHEGRKPYWEETGSTEGGVKVDTNPDTAGRKHSNWLSMMYPRLLVSRLLLKKEGVIFVSIDDKEFPNLKRLLDDVFGEENHVGTIVWNNATDNNPTNIAVEHEYILCYAREKSSIENAWKSPFSDVKDKLIAVGDELISKYSDGEELQSAYSEWLKDNKPYLWPLQDYKFIDRDGVYTGIRGVHNPGKEGYRYDIIHPVTKKPCKQPLMGYRFPQATMDKLLEADKIIFGDDETKIVELKVYARDFKMKLSSVMQLDGRSGAYDLKDLFSDTVKAFDNPKPKELIKELLAFVTYEDDLVLDFFSGSGTTSQAVIELNERDKENRRYILIQLPEQAKKGDYDKISDICLERVKRVISKTENPEEHGHKVYKLTQSHFPRLEFAPDPDKSEEENIEAFRRYIQQRESQLLGLFPEESTDLIDEVLLKNGFRLDYRLEVQAAFTANTVWSVTDGYQQTLLCLDNTLQADTTAQLLADPQRFICLEGALDTSTKWNLKQHLKEQFVAF